MERDQRKHSSSDAPAPAAADHRAPAPDSTASSPSRGMEPRGEAGPSAGPWEASSSLMEAMGVASSPTIFRDALEGAPTSPSNPGAVDAALSMSGQGMSHSSGATFHTDSTAASAAASMGASAFTAGGDVYFGEGRYAPGTASGDSLIQHELTHVDQTRGMAAPTPGNYQLSSPSDAAEVSASGAAAASTIHRKLAHSEELEKFIGAVAGGKVAEAKGHWTKMGASWRQKIRSSAAITAAIDSYPGAKPDPIEWIMDVMKRDALDIMKDVGAAFDKVEYVDAILAGAGGMDAKAWRTALKAESLWDPWLAKMPSRSALTEDRLTKLNAHMAAATTTADARKIWEQAYPEAMDASYGPTFLKTAAWATADLQRMWTAMQGKIPLAHAQTVSGGFNLGTQEKLFTKDKKGNLKWAALGFGWYHNNVIVMPKASSVAGGNGTGHDMTGGASSGVVPAGTAADPTLTHWDGTMLHEIGHGVSAKVAGEAYATTQGDWKGGQDWDPWSKKLFDDATAQPPPPPPPPAPVVDPNAPVAPVAPVAPAPAPGPPAVGAPAAPAVLTAAEAREFLAKEIAGTAWLPTAATGPAWTRASVMTYINGHASYKAQPLVAYHAKVKSGSSEYIVDANNAVGDRTYVWLSRGGMGYTDYKKSISDNKVSWYSLSSLIEWFAEQYTSYYRTGKAAPPGPEGAAIKAKFDGIDKMEADASGNLTAPPAVVPAPPPPTPSTAAQAASSSASPGAAAAAGADPASAGADPEAMSEEAQAAQLRGEIQRMNFF